MKLFLTQTDPPRDEVTTLLAKKGWTFRHAPLREVTYLDNAFDPIPLEGIILSSPKAARWLSEHHAPWELERCWFAIVGHQTLSHLKVGPLRKVFGPFNHAQELVDHFLQKPDPKYASMSVSFLAGETRMPTIEEKLQDTFMEMNTFTCYKTVPLEKPIKPDLDECVLFFSPSAVRDFNESWGEPKGLYLTIGPTTHAEMKRLKWNSALVSEKPQWPNIVEACEKYLKERS